MVDEEEIERIKEVLKALIAWMAQSANSPISRSEAMELIRRLGDD